MILLSHPTKKLSGDITIFGSKSESNRWLILQKLYPEIKQINNISDSEDTRILHEALHKDLTDPYTEINVGHAGTAMRFLTAYFALQPAANVILKGSERMHQRPIAPLVNALRELGCGIEYLENEGFPPLKISGKSPQTSEITIDPGISSQFITALILNAPKLPKGLRINFSGKPTSRKYIAMTVSQLNSLGIQTEWTENDIQVFPKDNVSEQQVNVESDWSSASYWYSMAALANEAEIRLKNFREDSLQGDAEIKEIFHKFFGINSQFENEFLILHKNKYFIFPEYIELDLNSTPDIAQTIAVTCSGLKIKSVLKGLKTLKIKETDRLSALQQELKKTGTETLITEDSIALTSFSKSENIPVIHTYGDHRMAMSFAPLSLKFPLRIENEEVVVKSYRNFWKDLEKAGFQIIH